MRSIGLGTSIPVKRQRIPDAVIVGTRRIGDLSGVLQQISEFAAQLGPMIGGLLQQFGGAATINGGEVRKQLTSTGAINRPFANAYMDWCKRYNPHNVWNTGDIWDYPDTHPSPWETTYNAYLAAGMPPNTLLDQQMKPVGLAAAAQAVAAQQTAAQSETPPNQQQLQAMQILAMQIAGMEGAAVAQQAAQTVSTMPASWQAYVNSLVQIWQREGARMDEMPGSSGSTSNNTGNLVLALVGAKMFGLF